MITSFDYYKQIESPDMYLCNPDQKLIGAINALNRHVALRFNDLSELTFTVPKNINKENDYEMVATKRLIFIDKIGWFQIISVVENTEGEVVSKTVTAESHQTMFKNKGFVTEGRVYMFYNPNDPLDSRYDSSNVAAIPSVVGQLHQQLGIKVALNNSEITPTEDKVDWTITWIDPSLKFSAVSYNAMYEALEGASNICRSFEENTEQFGYDFIINNVEIAFGVVFEFDFLYHTISIKPLEEITKPTDIYLSFDNVMNSMSVSENSEDIVTVLTCSGSELDIRTVNPMGTNYICNFDYYAKRISDDGKIPYPWMSEELISALEDWKEEFEKWQTHDDARTNHTRSYSELTAELQRLYSEKLVFDEAITKSNLQLQTLFAARDQYLSKSSATKIEGEDGEEWIGSAPVIVETVDGETKSLLSTSGYYNAFFNGTANITGYKSQPNVVKRENKFAYDFSGIESKTGSANSLIAGYMQDLEENELAELENLYLYFTDDSSTESFCKLNVKSEVGVAKDVNENIVSFIQTAGEAWTAKTGTVELQGITFSISRTTATGAISVASGGSAIITFTSNSYFVYNNLRFYVTIGSDGIVSLYCFYVSGFDRYTTYTKLTGDSGWCSLWENYINNTLVTESDDYAEDIQAIQDEMVYINAQCNVQTYIKNKSQALYNELSNYWIEGSYNNDNLAVLDTTTMDERIELAKELMETAEQDLIRSSQPQFSLSVTAINFIKLIQFRGFTSQLELGRTITVEKTEDILYSPALLSMEYDLDDVGSFSLTFSNAAKVDETMMTYAELLQETSSVSRTVSSNWLNLTEYARNKDSLKKLTEAPLDRTLRAAQKNMAAQAFIVDETGVLGRKYEDDSKTSFVPEQIRIINNTILFTQDNWETSKMAIGKILFDEYEEDGSITQKEGYGVLADAIIGSLLQTNALKVVNNSGSIFIDENGIRIKHWVEESEERKLEDVFNADLDGNLTLYGDVHAKTGTIDIMTLNGRLYNGELMLGAFTNIATGETDNLLMFGNISGDIIIPTTLVKDGYIQTQYAKIDYDILIGGNVMTYGICAPDGVSGLAFNMYFSEDGTPYYALLTTSGTYVYVTTYNQEGVRTNLTEAKSFSVKAYLPWGSSSGYNATITVAAGTSQGSWNTNAFWGSVNSVHFTATGNTRCDFTQGGSSLNPYLNIGCFGNFLPYVDNVYSLGGTGHRWKNIYAGTAEIITSDEQLKKDIENLPQKYEMIFDLLRPVIYRYKENDSNRIHTGIIAQELKEAIIKAGLTTKDLAAYCEWNILSGGTSCGIRYEELIALCIAQIQKLKSRANELETQLKELKGE